MWTASYTQSGESVTAVNESYNATIAPGGSVTIGFTGTFTSNDTARQLRGQRHRVPHLTARPAADRRRTLP